MVNFPGRKHSRNLRPFYVYLSSDAANALQDYLKNDREVIKKGEPIFINDFGNAISAQNIREAFNACAIKAEILKAPDQPCPKCGGQVKRIRRIPRGEAKMRIFLRCLKYGADTLVTKELYLPRNVRYKAHVHEMRDVFRTEWQKSGADPLCAEFFLGHDVDKNGYDKFFLDHDYTKSQYAFAEPYFSILSKEPRMVPKVRIEELEQKVTDLEGENGELRQRLEKIQAGGDDRLKELERKYDSLDAILEFLKEKKIVTVFGPPNEEGMTLKDAEQVAKDPFYSNLKKDVEKIKKEESKT